MSNWEGIAGVQVGLRADQVMLFDKFTKEKKILTMKGKRLYVAKCIRQDVGPIVLPDKSKKICTFVLILAMGDGCGAIKHEVKPLMRVTCPDEDLGICRSPYNADEYIVNEDIIQMADKEITPHDATSP